MRTLGTPSKHDEDEIHKNIQNFVWGTVVGWYRSGELGHSGGMI